MKKRRPLEPILRAIAKSRRIALVSHVNPDGDTLGCALALREGLMQKHRRVEVFCQDPVSESLHFLPGADEIRQPESLGEKERFDLLIFLDISDEVRMGTCSALISRALHTAQIDHHGTNTDFCQINFVDAAAPSCALPVYELLQRLRCRITATMALCLAVGLSTDTAHLTYNSTTPEAYRVMGELVEAGAPVNRVYRQLYRERPPRQVALLARALSHLQYHCNGQITSIRLTHQDFLDCGARAEDAEIIANYGMDIRGVRMSVFARENDHGSVTMSLRSIAPYQVNGIARKFGGGGHIWASGATVPMPLDELIRQVVDAMKEELEKDE